MKKYLMAILFAVLVVSVGCDSTKTEDNIEENNNEVIRDEITETENDAGLEPTEYVFVKTEETEALAAELYEYIPYPNAYVYNEVVTVKTPGLLLEDPINERIINKAINELNINTENVSADVLLSMCKKMYGPDFEFFSSDVIGYFGPGMLVYDSTLNSYSYVEDGGMGVNWFGRTYHVMTDYEIVGEYLYIYDKFGAVWDPIDIESGTTSNVLFGECIISENSFSISELDSSMKIRDLYTKLSQGEYDDILPTYKHTFAKADDGSYYWLQTEMVK